MGLPLLISGIKWSTAALGFDVEAKGSYPMSAL